MSRFLVFTVIVIAAAAVMPAATITCPQSGALSELLAMTTAGNNCQVFTIQGVAQDKIFSNFAYTPASGGVPATAVNFNLVLQTGTSDIHGWTFIPETAWVLGFTLSYDITVAPGFPLVALIQSKDQINSGQVVPPNGINVVDTQTGVGTITVSGTAVPPGPGETVFSNTYNLQTIHTSSVATIPVGKNLVSYQQVWFEGSSVPEPMSFVLIGTGLLGLGLMRRRVRKS